MNNRNLNSDKVVVIGGSGFIGSHVSDELSYRGFDVTVFDQAPSLWKNESQKMIVGDLLDRDHLFQVFEGARYIYHFGGIADIDYARQYPYDTVKTNIMGTATVLEAVRESSVERLLYASTVYVYSDQGSFYRASKQASEILIEAYQERYGVDFSLLRYGSLYGPRSQDWNGLYRYVKQILVEGEIHYNGTGEEKREYIHAEDAARLSVDVLSEDYINRAVTITGTQTLIARDVIKMIFEISGIEENAHYLKTNEMGDHYGLTPYRYSPKQATKIIPREFVDIGQGILDLVEVIHSKKEK